MPDISITKTDIVEANKGILQKQLDFVSIRASGRLELVMAELESHLDFFVQVENDGVLLDPGLHWSDDEPSWNGDGVFIFALTAFHRRTR